MKYKFKKYQNQAFTITEVLLVLAIASVIMAVVFISVPQLSRTQRDSGRKALAGRIKSEIETYAANNQGTYPFDGASGTPTVWSTGAGDCAVSNAVAASCYDWYNKYISGGKVDISEKSCAGNISIYYSNSTTNPPYTSWNCATPAPNARPGNMYIAVGAQCNGASLAAGPTPGSPQSKQYAIMTALDKFNTWYCIDNR